MKFHFSQVVFLYSQANACFRNLIFLHSKDSASESFRGRLFLYLQIPRSHIFLVGYISTMFPGTGFSPDFYFIAFMVSITVPSR